jgi:hypothetical protein
VSDFKSSTTITRRIVRRTRGQGHGPITRLMSPSDLGETLKPFVFLDLVDADKSKSMPWARYRSTPIPGSPP